MRNRSGIAVRFDSVHDVDYVRLEHIKVAIVFLLYIASVRPRA